MKILSVDINDLKLDPNNARRHPERNIKELERSLKSFGQHRPAVVQKNSGQVIIGNGMIEAMRNLGWESCDVLYVDDDDTTAVKRALADNRIADLSDFDDEILENLMNEYALDDIPGFSAEDIEDLLSLNEAEFEGLTDENEVPEEPETPISKLGDMWILGDHRLMCGDSTDAGNVDKLMAGVKADMVFTDPPYGVDYTGKTKDALKIQNDSKDKNSINSLVIESFGLAKEYCRPGAYWYATVPAGPLHIIFASAWERLGILRQILVWMKDSLVLGHSEYHYIHEPILFGWTPGGDRYKNPDRTRVSVWQIPRPKRSIEHPTMKPLELCARAIKDGSKRNNRILDIFGGSGSTLIACEKLNRNCYMMELDPKYVDVIIKRWQDFTGEEAISENTGEKYNDLKREV